MGIVPAPGLARSSGTSTVPQRRSPRRAHDVSNAPAPDGEGDGSTRRSGAVHEVTTSTAAPRTAPRAEGRIRVRLNPETPFRSDGAGRTGRTGRTGARPRTAPGPGTSR